MEEDSLINHALTCVLNSLTDSDYLCPTYESFGLINRYFHKLYEEQWDYHKDNWMKASPLEFSDYDIELVMGQTGACKKRVLQCFIKNNGDIINTIMDLTAINCGFYDSQ